MRPTALLLLVLSALTACQPQPDPAHRADEAAVRATLAALADRFSLAYTNGDAAAMTALYTTDAVLLPDGAVEVQGHEAIQAYWTLPESERITHHRITPTRVEVEGTTATDYGTYEVSGVAGGQAWGPSYGNYLIIWKRGTDGQWRMQLDMWNRRPSPAAPPAE